MILSSQRIPLNKINPRIAHESARFAFLLGDENEKVGGAHGAGA